MPISRQARITRTAISPRFATRIFLNGAADVIETTLGTTNHRGHGEHRGRRKLRVRTSVTSLLSVSSLVRRLTSHSVRIQQYLASLSGLQPFHTFAEVFERHAVGDH